MMQHLPSKLNNKCKQIISLLLTVAMIWGMAPQSFAEEVIAATDAEITVSSTEADEPKATEADEPKAVEDENSEAAEEPKAAEDENSESAEEEASETEAEETNGDAETAAPNDADDLTLGQQLQEMETLQQIYEEIIANPEKVSAFTVDEITALKSHTQLLYSKIEQPTEQDEQYRDMIMEELSKSTENVPESTFSQRLQEMETLRQVYDAMTENPEAVKALTSEEAAELRAYCRFLYNKIEDPTDDDDQYRDMILELLSEITENMPELTFSQQLQEMETLQQVYDAIIANPEAAGALPEYEISVLKSYVRFLYNEIEGPTEQDAQCRDQILAELSKIAEGITAPAFSQQLQKLGTLQEIFDAMMADPEAVEALTAEEITELKSYVQSLYDAIEEPTADDTEYCELILDTLAMFEEKQPRSVKLLNETATISRNGSRIMLSEGTAIWQRSSNGETYENISDETAQYYDLTAADSKQYIRAKIGDDAYTDPINISGTVAVFDIAKGKVTLGATYSGKDADDNSVSGSHAKGNIYIIMQSNSDTMTTNIIEFSGHHPDAPFEVTLAGVNMGATPTNHNQSPGLGGSETPGVGHISIPASNSAVKNVTVFLQGENAVRNITYYNGGDTNTPQTVKSSLKITDINGDGEADGSLYIPKKLQASEIADFVATKTNYNHWNAGIGGTDGSSLVQNLHIAGGKIQVATTLGDNCTAIGAGGNGYCQMEISGGEVIAHCNGTGAAIGGGIGWNAAGGTSNVLISGGTVYAKNHSNIKNGEDTVGGVAIGAGSSFHAAGSEGKVTITGGTVEAYGTFGNGIGGGNSSTSTGGKATIEISGGTVTATSIGGGNSKKGAGGNATVNVSGSADVTLEKGIGGGLSENGVGGTANITVNGGSLNAAGTIGGGTGGYTGNGGDATVKVTDGTLIAKSIGGGTGSIGGNGGAAKIEISGGTIDTGSIGGGNTLNPTGKLGYATADITGGDITGQFLLMAGGTDSCYFNMSGGDLHGVDAADEKYSMKNGAAVYMDDPTGTVTISGGTIQDCSAANGGAIYMTAGTFTMSDSAVITNCSATVNGGAVYLGSSGEYKGTFTMQGGVISDNHADSGSGGAIYLSGGDAIVNGGIIGQAELTDGEGNKTVIGLPNSAQNGGGAYLDGGNLTVSGGAISGNKADKNGGGAYVNGGSMTVYDDAQLFGNIAETDGGGAYVNGGDVLVYGNAKVSNNIAGSNGGGIAVNNGNFSMEGGSVDYNQAEDGNGGGIYVSSDSTDEVKVDVLSGSVSNNRSGNNGGALAVKGDEENTITVTIGVNKNHFPEEGDPAPEHGELGSITCPEINNNTSETSGGAVYVTGSKKAQLNIHCMTEVGNVAGDVSKPSHFMMVQGGTVEINTNNPNTPEDEANQDGTYGHIVINNEIYVEGGDVDIWGNMTNPTVNKTITVDIKDGHNDEFDDHRINNAADDEWYKLLYFENFTDPNTGTTTGLYQQYPVKKGDSINISGFLYSHPGYEIGGWNTNKDNLISTFAHHNPDEVTEGMDFINDGIYKCGDEYLFDGTFREDLTLYAIWDPIGYAIIFEPNASAYEGTMGDMSLKYDQKEKLPQNAFSRQGYYFKEWNRKADGSGQSYADQEYVVNLSEEAGRPVKLYAQWTACSHDPEIYTYTYTAEDNVVTGKCSCNGCTVTATLLASDVTYDQLEHKANLVITTNAAVGAEPASSDVEAKLRNITEVYESYTADAWTPMEDGKFPINAGQYRAGVTVSGQTAVKTYTIKKAPQPAPLKPTYKTNNDDSTILHNQLLVEAVPLSALVTADMTDTDTGKIGYDCEAEYAVIYDLGDGTISEPVWQKSVVFVLNTALTNYYVLARYSEGTNYEASEYSRADSKYFFAGNVSIFVYGSDGIDYVLREATIDNDVVTGVELKLTLKDGYYFPNGYKIDKIEVAPESNGPLTVEQKPSDYKTQIYSITSIKTDSIISIYLAPTAKLPTVKSYVTGGQVFADFDDTEAVISRDSAYTARFEVNNFDKDAYTGGFDIDGLPKRTPLILMKKVSGATTYYRAEASDTGVIPLDSFIGMGTESTGFLLNEAEQHITLQLIAIPFEDISGNEVSTAFILTHTDEQPNAADVSGVVTAKLKDKAKFEISEDDGSITLSYTPSAGIASIWDGRDNALVLKAAPGTPLPEDAKLSYSAGTFRQECPINAEGAFVIPLEELRSGDITLSFTLSTKMETGTYIMNAEWYVACSQAETAPMNGIRMGTERITLSAEKANVSVQISAQKHLYNARDILFADIKVNGVEGYTTKLDIQKKVDGKYVSIDVARTVIGNCTETFNLSDDPGSYRLYLYAYTSYDRVETAYYFIVK